MTRNYYLRLARTPKMAATMLAFALAAVIGGVVACANHAPADDAPGHRRLSIPLKLGTLEGTHVLRPVVTVSVGGGPAVPVTLDTGSFGLRILSTALGPRTQHIPNTAHVVRYGGGSFSCDKARAGVRLLGPIPAETPTPIVVDVIDPSTNPDAAARLARKADSQGILGIAPNAPPAQPDPVLSPLPQLPAPLSDGFTLNLPTAANQSGTLVLGPPTKYPATVTVPLTPALGRYPDGRPGWRRDLQLCWRVGTAANCGPTILDTGTGTAVASPAALTVPNPPGAAAPPGTPVTVSTREGTTLATFTTAADPPSSRLVYHRLLGTEMFNTGIGLYLTHRVAWDIHTGQLLITPHSALPQENTTGH